MATEQAKYRVLDTIGSVEIRQYEPQLVAETEVEAELEAAGNKAFGRLAGYIFGKNKGAQKIAMTAPVMQREGEKIAMTAPVTQALNPAGKYLVRFTMPAAYTRESLPEPLDPTVHIAEQPARRVAALRYSGTWSRKNYENHLSELRAALVQAALHPVGEPTWARYDPPWTPWFLRRNEVMFELAEGASNQAQ